MAAVTVVAAAAAFCNLAFCDMVRSWNTNESCAGLSSNKWMNSTLFTDFASLIRRHQDLASKTHNFHTPRTILSETVWFFVSFAAQILLCCYWSVLSSSCYLLTASTLYCNSSILSSFIDLFSRYTVSTDTVMLYSTLLLWNSALYFCLHKLHKCVILSGFQVTV